MSFLVTSSPYKCYKYLQHPSQVLKTKNRKFLKPCFLEIVKNKHIFQKPNGYQMRWGEVSCLFLEVGD